MKLLKMFYVRNNGHRLLSECSFTLGEQFSIFTETRKIRLIKVTSKGYSLIDLDSGEIIEL